jgi:hypothetical protein
MGKTESVGRNGNHSEKQNYHLLRLNNLEWKKADLPNTWQTESNGKNRVVSRNGNHSEKQNYHLLRLNNLEWKKADLPNTWQTESV